MLIDKIKILFKPASWVLFLVFITGCITSAVALDSNDDSEPVISPASVPSAFIPMILPAALAPRDTGVGVASYNN